MLDRGVDVSYARIRAWCDRFGQEYANQLRRRGRWLGDKWHLDEVFVQINGAQRYLWRAVDQHGKVLDILVQSHRRRGGRKEVLPPPAQGPAVRAQGDRHRQAGQLVGDVTLCTYRRPLSRRRKKLLCGHHVSARLDRMSSTLPCWSTARHRYRCAPLISTTPSSTPHLSPSHRPRRRSCVSAYSCPNRSHQATDLAVRTRRHHGRRHQLRHVAEAQREPVVQPDAMADDLRWKPEPFLFDEPAAVTIVDIAPPHLSGKPDSAPGVLRTGPPDPARPSVSATVFVLTCHPSARRSAVIRGDPSVSLCVANR